MSGCLIEAGLWLLDAGTVRFEAGVRIDRGMVAQIGVSEAIAYGNDDLPRYGAKDALAIPIFAPGAPETLASRLGGGGGRLTPGSPADLALFGPGHVPDRANLIAALRGEASGVRDLFVAGRALIAEGALVAGEAAARAALQAWLERAESAEEKRLWAAAKLAAAAARAS